jgi:AraC-like DNA-binding protein
MESSGPMYREFRAPPPLAPFVECLWRRDVTEDDVEERGVVLPDGRVDLVWIGGGEALIAGPQTRFVPRPSAPPYVAVGARFHPSVGPALLGVPAHELVDRHVPLAAVDAGGAAALRRGLPADLEPDDATAGIARALVRWSAAAGTPDPVVRAAVRLLDAPGAAVEQVAHRVGFSERELLRRFRTSVGYGPKTLQRVLRFQRVLAALDGGQAPGETLARLALSAGYADQAHMTRETRQLAGVTPTQLAQSA